LHRAERVLFFNLVFILTGLMPKSKAPYDDVKANALLLRITIVCWLLAKLAGWRMFTTRRFFPAAPVFDSLDGLPPVAHMLVFLLSVCLLVLLFFLPKNRSLLPALLAVETFSCLLDQNRLQPWAYQYLFVVLVFIVNTKTQRLVPVVLSFILACTYFYSGVGKLNEGFLQTIWTKMLLELFLKVPPHIALQGWVHYCGLFIGIFELISGAALLIARTRKIAAWMLILMHLFILLFLGPFGLRYNVIVWPWNLVMIAYLYLLFLRKETTEIHFKSIFISWNKLAFICWGILPALNLFGCWDNYLSSGIYSGKLPRMLICVKDTSKCKPLQKFCQKDIKNSCNGNPMIDLQYWAISETRLAPYPEVRVYKKIQHKLEQQYPAAGFSFIYIETEK
jgi:uncharacterized membrane protein YphA (DoxX/SURF4 family)